MRPHDVVIDEGDAERIDRVLSSFLKESGATEVLLIDRGGQLLAKGGSSAALDTVSISALAAGAFASTGAMAGLLGEPGFTVLFHKGIKESLHVSTVDDETILMAIFNGGTTIGMVRLFAGEASRLIAEVLEEARRRPKMAQDLGGVPLTADETQPAFTERPA